MGYIWKKFHFVSIEELKCGKENAFFQSSQGKLPVSVLAEYSMNGTLADQSREEIKAIVESESSDAWKDRKLVPSSGGGSRRDDDVEDGEDDWDEDDEGRDGNDDEREDDK